jgi:microcystin-dependent protein
MPLEAATYIDDLVATNPAASDGLSQADDHLRLIKSTLQATFPSVTGPVTLTQGALNNGSPAGMVAAYAGAAAPTGWLICNGAAVSRTTYALLFTAIGTTFGVGDGSTTFNVPDALERTIYGYDAAGSVTRLTAALGGVNGSTLGAAGGAESFTLAEANLPGHTHTLSVTGSGNTGFQSADHTHSGTTGNENANHHHIGNTDVESAGHTHSGTTNGQSQSHDHAITITDPGHTHSYDKFNSANQITVGGGPSAQINDGSTNTGSNTTGITADAGDASQDHNHTFTTGGQSGSHTHGFTTVIQSANHQHDFTTGNVSSNHFHAITSLVSTGTSGSVGSGTAKGLISPGIVMNWIIYTGL